MTTAIVTLVVGVVIICVSFFVMDGNDYKQEDEIYNESAEELKLRITELTDILVEQSKTSITECAEDTKEKCMAQMKEEVNKCGAQLSAKAKKEMIDYINKSLAEAFEAYNPESEEKPEPITYDEPEDEPVADEPVVEDAPATPETNVSEADDDDDEEIIVEGEPAPDPVDATEEEASVLTSTDAPTDELKGEAPVPEQESNGGKSRKKNRKKKGGSKKEKEEETPEQIWDDEKNIDVEVKKLYDEGLSIMEIANQLGIGVGETKLIIKNIERQN